jgi:CheY-like chemotaxis protein
VLVHRRAPAARVLILTPETGPETDPAMPGVRAIVKPPEARSLMTIVEALYHDRLGEAPAVRRPLVLCVDDDDFYLSALRRILGRHGYRVVTFVDPDSALDALAQVKPDLAILDLRLPGMDGLDLADEIRRSCGERLPIVMLTGRGSDHDVSEGYRHGASYYITKPCSPRTVVNVVDYLVGDLDPQERTVLETQL